MDPLACSEVTTFESRRSLSDSCFFPSTSGDILSIWKKECADEFLAICSSLPIETSFNKAENGDLLWQK